VVRRREPEPADLLTIAEAAKLLGVSVQTLRRWDESGKFVARRHPMNSYRMYARDEIAVLRKKIADGGRAA
jgi:excisionase family DNA binding protein